MFIKATVTSFDPITNMSKCRGDGTGRTYVDVGYARAIGDDTSTPKSGDRVALWSDDIGQFWIVFKLDRVAQREEKAFTPDISPSGDQPISFTESTTLDSTLSISRTNIGGQIPGDKVITAKGGATIAALLGGVVLARVSAMCSVIMSKADDIFKMFVRNFEKHTSAASTIEASRGAASYTYTEYYSSQQNAFSNTPSFISCYGNVAIGMTYKLAFREDLPPPSGDTIVGLMSVPGKYSKTLSSEGVVAEHAEKELRVSTSEGNNTLLLNSDGSVLSSDVKIKLQVGSTVVELTPTKLKLLADLISENGV